MPLPPHLFKPIESIDLRLDHTEPSVPNGSILVTYFQYTPPSGMMAIIKDGNSTDDIVGVTLYFYKGGSFLFFNGQQTGIPLIKRQEHFWEYLRENPIILRDSDQLIVKVTNQSGAPQAVMMELFGYFYPEEVQNRYEKHRRAQIEDSKKINRPAKASLRDF